MRCFSFAVVAVWSAVMLLATGCGSTSEVTRTATTPAIEAHPAELAPADVAGRTWSLVELEDARVTVAAERARPSLHFDAKEKRVTGMAGVNRFGGGYAMEGGMLKFGPLMATKMAGPPELNDLESRFLRALEQTTAWRIDRGELELFAGSKILARLVAKR